MAEHLRDLHHCGMAVGKHVWRRFRGLPTKVQVGSWVVVGLALIGMAGQSDESATQVRTPSTTVTTAVTTSVAPRAKEVVVKTTTTTVARTTTVAPTTTTTVPVTTTVAVRRVTTTIVPAAAQSAPGSSCGADSYVNVDGDCIPSPRAAPSAPAGATAQCRDGTYSFSAHRQGTCSHHGGVAVWL
jgi:hypothetical protein